MASQYTVIPIVRAAESLIVIAGCPSPVQDVRAMLSQIRTTPCNLVHDVQVVSVVRQIEAVWPRCGQMGDLVWHVHANGYRCTGNADIDGIQCNSPTVE